MCWLPNAVPFLDAGEFDSIPQTPIHLHTIRKVNDKEKEREKTPLNQKLNEIRALRTDVTLTFWHLNGRQSSLIVSFSYGQCICSGAHECTSGVASYLKIIPLYLTFSLFTFKK